MPRDTSQGVGIDHCVQMKQVVDGIAIFLQIPMVFDAACRNKRRQSTDGTFVACSKKRGQFTESTYVRRLPRETRTVHWRYVRPLGHWHLFPTSPILHQRGWAILLEAFCIAPARLFEPHFDDGPHFTAYPVVLHPFCILCLGCATRHAIISSTFVPWKDLK